MKRQLHKRMSPHIIWQVMGEFAKGTISVGRACEWMEISRSRLYQLLDLWRKTPHTQGAGSWVYQRSNLTVRSLPADVQEFLTSEMRYWRESSEYFKGHINFAMLAEECHKRFGTRFHRNTIRRWAIRQGLFDPKTDSTRKAFVRFETGGIGMLFQHDSSLHAWVPAMKQMSVLILTVDDHSRKIVGYRLVPRDTAWHHLCVIRDTLETYGCPLSYYTDNAGLFRPELEPFTQVGRALDTVGVALKFTAKAHPEAKGKVEKRFDYLQRRIPFLCEQRSVTNYTQANNVVREVIEHFNEYHIHEETKERPNHRWRRAIEENRSYLRPIPAKTPLDIVFALHYQRAPRKDGRINFGGHSWPISQIPSRGKVTVVLRPPTSSRRPHTEIFMLLQGSTINHFILSKAQRLTLK
jgi:hypothetical protein